MHRIDGVIRVPLAAVTVRMLEARSIEPSLLAIANHPEPPLDHAARDCCS